MRHFCTYFDHRFLIRALALHRSLRRHAGSFTLHALCLDDDAYDAIVKLNLPDLHPISLREFEAADPQLAQTKNNRSLVEYYFTCSPALPLYVLNHVPAVDRVTYLDADLYFFSDPTPIENEMGAGSVLIIPHRYPPANAHLEANGRYNVGLLSFRNDPRGRACLQGWRKDCINWCYERPENGKYADQGYLNDWLDRYRGVVVLSNPAANLAPWNLIGHKLQYRNRRVLVDANPLVFYHFHRLKIINPWLFDPGLERYHAAATPLIARKIYAPYLRQLRDLMHKQSITHAGNLRLQSPDQSTASLARILIYNRSLICMGPLSTPVHLEPIARPFLRLRQIAKKAVA